MKREYKIKVLKKAIADYKKGIKICQTENKADAYLKIIDLRLDWGLCCYFKYGKTPFSLKPHIKAHYNYICHPVNFFFNTYSTDAKSMIEGLRPRLNVLMKELRKLQSKKDT